MNKWIILSHIQLILIILKVTIFEWLPWWIVFAPTWFPITSLLILLFTALLLSFCLAGRPLQEE